MQNGLKQMTTHRNESFQKRKLSYFLSFIRKGQSIVLPQLSDHVSILGKFYFLTYCSNTTEQTLEKVMLLLYEKDSCQYEPTFEETNTPACSPSLPHARHSQSQLICRKPTDKGPLFAL